LVAEVWEKWRHCGLRVIATILLSAKGPVFKGVTPGSVIAFPARVEFVELMGGEWGNAEERMEEDL